VALAAPALLVALEVAGAATAVTTPAAFPAALPELEPVAPRVPVAATTAPVRRERTRPAPVEIDDAPERDRQAELLHDLRSPLSVIRVYTDLIQEAARLVGAPASVPEPVELLEKPQNADLVEILGSLATAYRLAHGGRIRIEFIAERPQLPVVADPVALQRAFRNVLDNAIKYTPDGGEVRIRAGGAGAQAFVVVKDTGMGMSPEERARAFDYAFRGAGAVASGTRGKGLGLAVTKEILEANGGKISLSSEAGYGSEVTIMLPAQRGAR
jgi:signal transduction histidine kinase